ncbi:MAG: hypothetical protein WDW38_008042 [Sanguina aurantia]
MSKRRAEAEEEEMSEEEEEDDDEEAEEVEVGPGGRGTERPAIYDVDAIHEKLEDIGWTSEKPWEETIVIMSSDATQLKDVDDDLARELSFYNQALSAVQQASAKLEAAGTPWRRPLDYFAEMVKTDEHMSKVKKQLMYEQQQIEQADERRKQREAKQFGKQVQQAKEKERLTNKKQQIDSISKMRKQREKTGFAGEADYDAAIEGKNTRQPSTQKAGQRMPSAGSMLEPAKKRLVKDAKFGFGGRKGNKKQNDSASTADMENYKPGRFDDGSRGAKKPGGAGGKFGGGAKGGVRSGGVKKVAKKGKVRPGKEKRAAMKGKQ